jgi:Na+/H+ antiporter NhaD/arsenite permease-like protein
MNYPHPGRTGSPLTASLPPPAAMTFVTRILLAAIAFVAGVALIASAPLAVTLPLGSIFAVYFVAALVFREREPEPERESEPEPEREPADRSLIGLGTLTLGSIAMLAAAFLAPERFGIGLAAVGFAGLLVARIYASAAGWAPRYTFPGDGERKAE